MSSSSSSSAEVRKCLLSLPTIPLLHFPGACTCFIGIFKAMNSYKNQAMLIYPSSSGTTLSHPLPQMKNLILLSVYLKLKQVIPFHPSNGHTGTMTKAFSLKNPNRQNTGCFFHIQFYLSVFPSVLPVHPDLQRIDYPA